MMQDSDELLRQAIYERSQRGSHYPTSFTNFPVPLPPIPEDMNASTEDDYEIYVLDGKIRARPKVQKKEIFIDPSGKQLPEDVQEQIRGYGSEDDSLSFLKSFLNDDVAGVPYTLPDQQIFYETGGKVHQMPRPIKQDYDIERLIQSMKDRYRV
jgi:hypothetical protein